MPSNRPSSGPKPSQSPSNPYEDTSRRRNLATIHQGIPPGENMGPLRPPLPLGQESQIDVARECIQKRFPDFVPRNNLDIVSLAGIADVGPTDQASIYALLDMLHQTHIPHRMEKYNCTAEQATSSLSKDVDLSIGRIAATDTIGAKPRAGQKIWVRVMPSWPEYSIRLWASSADVQLFGMDFVLSATGAPINLSHRFKLYTTAWIYGPGGMDELPPFDIKHPPGTSPAYNRPPGPRAPGEELYMVGEEQTIVVEDRLGLDPREVARVNMGDDPDVKPLATLLKFTIPKHPVHKTRKLHPGVKYDEVHWSLDE
ncbi:hypothetical protein D9619_011668 [Psilocybe cf. subviscida]|uniref:Uncharacterized protein n=1 Tax=Psilocybe cf. subviscida TaxID=2480587 RepID=A0A8H5BT63_9AGAR|nr:hypothetical protein D9619_011668 [Psilocybe cf. subviscida]